MIIRIKHGSTELDFGSLQAANQFLDNYPPHTTASISIAEISAEGCRKSITTITSEMSRIRPGTQHCEWLESRLEFYTEELPLAEQREANIQAQVAALPIWEGGRPPSKNEVYDR